MTLRLESTVVYYTLENETDADYRMPPQEQIEVNFYELPLVYRLHLEERGMRIAQQLARVLADNHCPVAICYLDGLHAKG